MLSEPPKIQEPLTFTIVEEVVQIFSEENKNKKIKILGIELVEIYKRVNSIPELESAHAMEIKSEVLEVWVQQQNQERELRKDYSTQLMNIFWVQLIVMYLILFPTAFGIIPLTTEQFSILFVSVLVEIAALVTIVTKYLFSKEKTLDISDLWKRDGNKEKEK